MQWSPWQQKLRGHLWVCSSACAFLFLHQSVSCDAAVTNTPRLPVVMTVVLSGSCDLWAAVGCGPAPCVFSSGDPEWRTGSFLESGRGKCRRNPMAALIASCSWRGGGWVGGGTCHWCSRSIGQGWHQGGDSSLWEAPPSRGRSW